MSRRSQGKVDVEWDESAEKDLEAVLAVATDLANRCGIPNWRVIQIIGKLIGDAEMAPTVFNADKSISSEFRRFYSAIVSIWRMNDLYWDDDGLPLPLRERGDAPSMESLVGATCEYLSCESPSDIETVVSVLSERGVIEKSKDGLWERRMDAFPLNNKDSSAVISQLAYLAEFAGTVHHNIDSEGLKGRFCSVAHVQAFPEKETKLIQEMCWGGGMDFLKTIDQALIKGGERAKGSDEPSVTTGVGVYFFKRDR